MNNHDKLIVVVREQMKSNKNDGVSHKLVLIKKGTHIVL